MSSEFVVGEVYTRIPHGWRRKLADGDEYHYDIQPGDKLNWPGYDVSRLGPKPRADRVIMTDDPAKVVFKSGSHPETLNPMPPMPKHENVTDRIESIVKRLTEIEATIGPLAPYRVRSVDQDLSAIHARIAKSDEEAALNLTATDARLDRLSGMINDLEDKFDKRCTDLGHKADGAHTRIKAVSNALAGTDHEGENVKRRLNKLENLPGLATLNAAVVRLQDDMETGRRGIIYRVERFEKATTDALANRGTVNVDLRQVHNRINRMKESVDFLEDWQRATQARADGADIQTPKRDNPAVIGRWVNIYKTPSGDAVAGPATFSSQWAADQAAKQDMGNRVACIQINEAFG